MLFIFLFQIKQKKKKKKKKKFLPMKNKFENINKKIIENDK